MTKKGKIIKFVLMLLLAVLFIFVFPILFYNVLTDPAAIGGGSIIFLIIPVIVTALVGVFILYLSIKSLIKNNK
jgi:hypothetical protein